MIQDVCESDEARERRIQCRVIAGLLVIGYCPGLWLFFSPWRRLLAEIRFAKQAVAESSLFAKSHFFPESSPPSLFMFAGFLLIFYALKLGLTRSIQDKLLAGFIYILLLFVSATVLYLKFEDWNNMHVTFAGNWFGAPFVLLPVPTVTFIWDLTDPKPLSRRQLALRTMIEILIFIPFWTFGWIMLSFAVGFVWI